MVHKAIDLAEPGDVIVVDAGADLTNAIVGETMMRIAKRKGIAGFLSTEQFVTLMLMQ